MSKSMLTINELQNAIVEDFLSIGDPLSQYEYLLEFAGLLPALDGELKTDENLVEGCQSRVWLVMSVKDNHFCLRADSDTLIVRGILQLLIEVLDGQCLEDVAVAELFFLEKAQLMITFDNTRRKGIGSTITSIKKFAIKHAPCQRDTKCKQ